MRLRKSKELQKIADSKDADARRQVSQGGRYQARSPVVGVDRGLLENGRT